MKKLIFLSLALLALACGACRAQQTASAVLDRYYSATGIDRIGADIPTARITLNTRAMGMTVPVNMVIDYPGKRMSVGTEAMGSNIRIVIDGQKGWMEVPGMGKQPLDATQAAQMWQQNDILSNMKWDPKEYDITLLGTEEHDGAVYDVVAMKPRQAEAPFTDAKLYFDRSTALLSHTVANVSQAGRNMEVKSEMKRYKSVDKLRYPSVIVVSADGNEISQVEILTLELNVPVTEEMFAE